VFSNQVEQYGHNFEKHDRFNLTLMCLFSEQAYQQYQKYSFGLHEVLSLYSEQHSAFTILLTFNTASPIPPEKTLTQKSKQQKSHPEIKNLSRLLTKFIEYSNCYIISNRAQRKGGESINILILSYRGNVVHIL